MKKIIKNVLLAELQENQADHNEYLMLVEIAKKYEGKKITKRFQNDLPEGFKLKEGFQSYEIESPRLYGAGSMEGQHHKHYLCRYDVNNNGGFTLKHFEDNNAPNSRGAEERIEKLSGILNDTNKLSTTLKVYIRLAKAYNDLQTAIASIEDTKNDNFNNPANYDILRALNIDSKIISDIKYK